MIIAPYCFYVQRCRTSYLNPRCITKRLRGIWHAWHFYYALGSVFKALCGSFCIACLHPLTRRYTIGGNGGIWFSKVF